MTLDRQTHLIASVRKRAFKFNVISLIESDYYRLLHTFYVMCI